MQKEMVSMQNNMKKQYAKYNMQHDNMQYIMHALNTENNMQNIHTLSSFITMTIIKAG